jgi:hypothetical protein
MIYLRDSDSCIFFFWYKCKYNVDTPNYTIFCHLSYGLIMEEDMNLYYLKLCYRKRWKLDKGYSYSFKNQYESNKEVKNFCIKIGMFPKLMKRKKKWLFDNKSI